MDAGEFAQSRVDRIDTELYRVRCEIERLMQLEEFLVEERVRWVGRVALDPTAVHAGVERRLMVIPGGAAAPEIGDDIA